MAPKAVQGNGPGFTKEEKAAMRATARERKVRSGAQDAEREVLEKIAGDGSFGSPHGRAGACAPPI